MAEKNGVSAGLPGSPDSPLTEEQIAEMARAMPVEIWRTLRQAVELGKWPDGEPLTEKIRAAALAAVLVWEDAHAGEDGSIEPGKSN